MLVLNLIPQQLKQKIKFQRIYSLIRKMNFVLIIITIIIAIILLVAKLLLQNNFNEVVEQTTKITKNSQTYNIKVRDINSLLNQVLKIQDDFINWSYLIEDIASKTPIGVKLSGLKINKEEINLDLIGRAATRDDLLNFKQKLEESPIYYDIELPLRNILEKENINFDIKTKLNFTEIN